MNAGTRRNVLVSLAAALVGFKQGTHTLIGHDNEGMAQVVKRRVSCGQFQRTRIVLYQHRTQCCCLHQVFASLGHIRMALGTLEHSMCHTNRSGSGRLTGMQCPPASMAAWLGLSSK